MENEKVNGHQEEFGLVLYREFYSRKKQDLTAVGVQQRFWRAQDTFTTYNLTFCDLQKDLASDIHRTSMDPPPPWNGVNISQLKCATAPPQINILQSFTATAPLPLELPDGCNGQAGLGLGLGLGVQGQGQAELGLGSQGVLGRLPDHSSLAMLKNVDFRYRPTTARPLEMNKH
jgi:muconolactone delta-isomerase